MRTHETIELRRVLRVLQRWAWLVALCGSLALVVALFVTARLPPVYEATTTLLMAPVERTITSEINSMMAGEKLALTYVQLLKGPSNLQAVIDKLGLPETAGTLAKRIQISPVADTQLVRVTVSSNTPEGAALLANTLADVSAAYAKTLQEHRYRDYLLSKAAKIEGLENQIEEIQAQFGAITSQKIAAAIEVSRLQGVLAEHQTALQPLEEEQQALQLFVERVKDNVKIVGPASTPGADAAIPYTAALLLLVDQGGANVGEGYSLVLSSDQLAVTYAQMITRPAVLDAAIAKLGLEKSLDPREVTVTAEPVVGTQLVRLQVSGADPPRMANLADAVAEVFVAQTHELLAKSYASRLVNIESEIATLQGLIDAAQHEIQDQTAIGLRTESDLLRLEAALVEHRTNHRISEQEYDQASLLSSQGSGTVVITERAQTPDHPKGNNLLYVLLAVVVAAIVALGDAFLIEYLDESIKTAEDVNQTLGLSTLGSIEHYGKGAEKPVWSSKSHSRAAEAYSMLATNVRLSGLEGRLRTVLVTSPTPADGKTSVAANLAVAAANAGLRVVVVDADLRKPRLHEMFGLSAINGLTEALLPDTPSSYLKPTNVERVRVLTSGQLPHDPVSVVSSPRMKKLFDDLAQEADLVIVDSPPVLAVADATILAASADGVLLVVRAGQTPTQAVRRAVGTLHQTKAHLLGVVLNAVSVRNDEYYGRYYTQRDEALAPSLWQRLAGLSAGRLSRSIRAWRASRASESQSAPRLRSE